MTRLVTTGWETGDVAEAGVSSIGASTTHTVVSVTPTPRAGSYCFKIATSAGSFSASTKSFGLGASKTEVWARFAFFSHPLTATNTFSIAQMLDSAASASSTLSLDCATGLLLLRLGGASGAVLGTASAGLSIDAWHVIEWRTQITSITVGVSEVWLDGTRVINFSGDNVGSALANVQTMLLGVATTIASSSANGQYFAYDDLAINDTAGSLNNGKPGDGRVVLLSPSAAGSSTALTRGGTDTGANWSQTSEVPSSMTQYVFSATAATRDLYTLGDLTVTPGSINTVDVLALAQNSDAGAGSIGLTVKSGATTNEGSAQALATTAQYYRQAYETDPATSAAWTASAVNALEAGVTVR